MQILMHNNDIYKNLHFFKNQKWMLKSEMLYYVCLYI